MRGIIIDNAEIIDGTGAPAFKGAVAVEDGLIAAVDKRLDHAGMKIFDARGLTLTPGFIDSHGHSDISLLANPGADGKISQGVTTEIAGNCGLSAFPVTDKNRRHLEELYRNYDEKITWRDIDGYATELESRRPAINLAAHCGHNTARAAVAGYETRRLSPTRTAELAALVESSLNSGAAGLSTGLLYVPGKFADRDEIINLLKIVVGTGKIHATHLRSEGSELLEALRESIDNHIAAGRPRLHISHLKAGGEKNWGKLPAALELIRRAPLKITADRYPYIESMTSLSVVLPAPFDELADTAVAAALDHPVKAGEIVAALGGIPASRWREIRLVSTHHPRFQNHLGELLADISTATGQSAPAICAEILRRDAVGAMAAFAGMSGENLGRIMTCGFVSCGSDESARPEDYSLGRSHPRGFGSFPRFIKRLNPGTPIEQAIARITSLPAQTFRLKDRGLIKTGFAADLALIDPDEFTDTADFTNPHGLSAGVRMVWVNGGAAFGEGKVIHPGYGRFIKIK